MTEDPNPKESSLADGDVDQAELHRQLQELENRTNERLIHGELKAYAIAAGMVDLDGLKLVDSKEVTVDASGEVRGAAQAIEAARKAKPWLFGPRNASSPATPPPAEVPKARKATEMTAKEWRAARAELLRRRQ
jgi:hypothetical protein